MRIILRFLTVGAANTVVGYAIILLGLRLGWGDYAANAVGYGAGLLLSYSLHRNWTFAVATPPTFREAANFTTCAALSFSVNLAVLYLARSMGYVDNFVAQAAAVAAYSTSFFLLARYFVFA